MIANTSYTRTLFRQNFSDYPAEPVKHAAPGGNYSKSINKLICAAVVSSRFCRQLLSDPVAALATGYNGEKFHLTAEEIRQVCSIQASSLRDFSAQLLERMQEPVTETASLWVGEANADVHRRVGIGQAGLQ